MKETFIFFSVLVVLFFVGKFAINNRDKNTMQNCNYSYAQITKKYKYGELAKGERYGAGSSLASVDFIYNIDGRKYHGRTSIPKKAGVINTGDKYMIALNKNDNEKFIVMFNYPIKDSTDFKRYVKEFEEKRKKQNK
jgi:hypothetical protein